MRRYRTPTLPFWRRSRSRLSRGSRPDPPAHFPARGKFFPEASCGAGLRQGPPLADKSLHPVERDLLNGSIAAQHASLGAYHLYAEPEHELLFCDNETNVNRLYAANAAGYFHRSQLDT